MLQFTDVDKLPTGLIVRHLPARVQAVPDGESFRWEYRTAVSAMADAVILGFAAFAWDGQAWVPRHPDGAFFTPGDFAEWYASPGAKVHAALECADSTNFCTGPRLAAERVKWVYVAEAGGRRVKGEAVVELLGELEPHARGLTDRAEQISANAELFRKSMTQYTGVALGFDEAGVKWLDGYVERNRANIKDNNSLLDKASCYFGECLRQTFGGEWTAGEDGPPGLRVDGGLVVFPSTKLLKHVADTTGDAGDSMLGMFRSIRPMMAVNAHKVVHLKHADGKTVVADPGPRKPPQPPAPPPSSPGWKFWDRK